MSAAPPFNSIRTAGTCRNVERAGQFRRRSFFWGEVGRFVLPPTVSQPQEHAVLGQSRSFRSPPDNKKPREDELLGVKWTILDSNQ
ncbi:MAG: hypothetical protein IJE77_12960 [Thermoguttaceae bacterium]|nr:hypothetical protein [Thermoguttaceae bacterium]